MTEQQYRVIADRDKGDEVTAHIIQPGDRVTYGSGYPFATLHSIVRIERPVPTTDVDERKGVSTDRLRDMADLLDGLLNRATLRQAADELDRLRASSPQPPTREQIAALVEELEDAAMKLVSDDYEPFDEAGLLREAARVLALIQNGADR